MTLPDPPWPDDPPPDPCDLCGGTGYLDDDSKCPDCDGPPDEPDDDYLYERSRDAKLENENG